MPGDTGFEPLLPRGGSADRLLQHRRDPAHGRTLQPVACPRASPLRRRSGVHRVLRQPPGRHQQGPRRHEDRRRRGGRGRRRHPVAGALPAHRSPRRRAHLRGRHPGELAVRKRRGRLHHESRPRPGTATPVADRIQPGNPADRRRFRRRRRRGVLQGDVGHLRRRVPDADPATGTYPAEGDRRRSRRRHRRHRGDRETRRSGHRDPR